MKYPRDEKNRFKANDTITVGSFPQLGAMRVKYIDGPYVYYQHPTYEGANASYDNCTFVANPTITSLLADGKYIDAIKEYRSITGLGLKESKDAVEELRSAMPKFKPGDVVERRNGGQDTIKASKTANGKIAYDYVGCGWDYESDLTLVRRADEGQTLGDILGKALASLAAATAAPRFKVGDRVAYYGIMGRKSGVVCDPKPNTAPIGDVVWAYWDSVAEATAEAERLAKANPGVEFATFTLAFASWPTLRRLPLLPLRR